jgi:leucyl-tRNA---protein transferase
LAPVTRYFTQGPCGYYSDRDTKNHCISDPRHEFEGSSLTRIINKGYRRFGTEYYRAYCAGCRECTPYRLIVSKFLMGRSLQRVRRINADLSVTWAKPQATQEKFELYVRYQKQRHKEGNQLSARAFREEMMLAMIQQMYMNPASTLEMTLALGEKVIGFAIFDQTNDSLSAVYSVFDPEMTDRSLGTLNILLAIEKAQSLSLPYLNLGLYLEGHVKMNYKSRFGPAEIYREFQWRPFIKG